MLELKEMSQDEMIVVDGGTGALVKEVGKQILASTAYEAAKAAVTAVVNKIADGPKPTGQQGYGCTSRG